MLVTLRIHDDGPGCPDDALTSLAQRGTRLDESTPGQGLGLAIAMQTAADYGGQIDFGSFGNPGRVSGDGAITRGTRDSDAGLTRHRSRGASWRRRSSCVLMFTKAGNPGNSAISACCGASSSLRHVRPPPDIAAEAPGQRAASARESPACIRRFAGNHGDLSARASARVAVQALDQVSGSRGVSPGTTDL